MSLSVELFDRPEAGRLPWTICSLDEEIELRLWWKHLPHDLRGAVVDHAKPTRKSRVSKAASEGEHQAFVRLRYDPPYVSQAVDGELPSTVDLQRYECEDPPSECWRGTVSIPAPKFWPMTVHAVVEHPQSDGKAATLRLIPRLSVVASAGLLIAAIFCFMIYGAVTVNSLSLTTRETLSGAGGLLALGLLGKLAHAVGRYSWPHTLPYLGIPYLLPRAMLTVLLGAASVIVAIQTHTVTVHNQTTRTVELHLPLRDEPDQLHVDSSRTYAHSREQLEDLLSGEGYEYLCLHDPQTDDGCGDFDKDQARIHNYLRPPRIELRCHTRQWQGVSYEQAMKLYGHDLVVPATHSPHDNVVLTVSSNCELVPEPSAALRIEAFVRNSPFTGTYQVTYPWTWEEGMRDLAVLGLDGAPRQTLLTVSRALDDGGSDGGQLFETQLQVDAPSALQPGVLVPAPLMTKQLTVNFSNGSGSSILTCMRTHPRKDTHFRAIHIAIEDHEAIRMLEARWGSSEGWSSTWVPEQHAGRSAWLCTVAPGRDSPSRDHLKDFATSNLSIVLAPGKTPTDLRIDIPRTWMARQIQIKSEERLLGTLQCSPGALGDESDTISIGTLAIDDWTPAHGVDELGVFFKDNVLEQNVNLIHSQWKVIDETSTQVPWACWSRSSGKHLDAKIRSDQAQHDATIRLGEQTLSVVRPALRQCWLEAERYSFHEGTPDRSDCKPATPTQKEEVVDARRSDCQFLSICGQFPSETPAPKGH